MPERGGAQPKERGRSTAKYQTTSSRCTPERSLAAGYSTLTQQPGSLKWERMPVPQPSSSMPSGSMLTQSPTQKNTKLKSIVHKVPPKEPEAHATSGWYPDRALPYHSMAEKPEDFMHYIMQSGLMVRDHFLMEIDNLMIFGHEQSSIACQIVASILYTELAWFKGRYLNAPKNLEAVTLWASRKTAKSGGTTCWCCSNTGRMPNPHSHTEDRFDVTVTS